MDDVSNEHGIDEIRRIVGEDRVRAASDVDTIDGIQPAHIVEPESAKQLAQVLAIANSSGLAIIPRGGGTKIDWGNPPRRADLVLSTVRLNRVLEHASADMTATVQAGCTLESFQNALAEKGQRLAVDPLFPDRATIGGILACNDSGALRATFGSIRDHLIGITVALPDGTLAKSGGKVVKNVAGYDLPKLFIGSFGTLGVIVEATFRLHPLPRASQTLQFSASPEHLTNILSALLDCSLITTAVQIDASDDTEAIISVLVEGLPDATEQKTRPVISAAQSSGAKLPLPVLGERAGERAEHQKRNEPSPTPSPGVPGEGGSFGGAQALFDQPGVICKICLLPTRIPALVDYLRAASSARGLRWKLVMQSVGVGLLSLRIDAAHLLPEWIQYLRQHLSEFSGALTILRCPADAKSLVDPWPAIGDSLPLMRRIKQQFDPNNTLSPGRFVGGI
jgi:glycolate oxidase FAD binding subunit